MAGVRVRFAPSPTGALHLGSALTAVANFLFARRAGGEFVLRVDDTDPERSNRRYERTIRQDAEWLGLRFDEGPDEGGPFGPYRQSERMPIYLEHAERLVAEGRAYREEGAIHFRAPADDIVVHDAARGDVRVAVGAIKDFVIVRTDGTATYQLATAVDDALMEVTHVIRGEDHLTNTARQIALFDALGLRQPRFAHTALLVSEAGAKLSKREGAPSIAELRGEGYPPEALLNYLAELTCPVIADGPALLGQLAQRFELKSISRGQSRFDRGRLDWLSQQHLKRLNGLELARRVGQVLELRGVVWHPAQMTALSEGLKGSHTLVDAADEAEAVLVAPRTPPPLDEVSARAMGLFADLRAGWPEPYMTPDEADELLDELKKTAAAEDISTRDVLHGIRVGLTGRERGVALRYVVAAIHRDDVLREAASVTIRLHDSLTKRAEPVVADRPLGIYSCGPTVYDRIHVGNARPFVIAMVLKRHLDRQGVPSKVVINVTDVNDKIYIAARERGISSTALAAEMTAAYFADTGRLGLGRPDVEPLVTETMPEIVALIARLIENGLAYEANGDVYFAVRSFPSYGDLSGQKPDEMLAEGRVEPGEGKRSPLDFALWKANKPDEDASWDSPWGRGRPGWHIECSAMAMAHLGEQIDVHGGGLDLIFPHHENERAQSEGATGHRFAGTWLHNGMLRFGDEKMSKSLGNVERLGDALDEWGAETLLLLFARAHYRSPMDYNDDTLAQARAAGEGLREAIRKLRSATGDGSQDRELMDEADRRAAAFDAALDDDLATPQALAELFGLGSSATRAIAAQAISGRAGTAVADTLVSRLDVLGLAGLGADDEVPAEIVSLAEERRSARAARDFARSDALRDQIAAAGYVVRDVEDGFELVPAPR